MQGAPSSFCPSGAVFPTQCLPGFYCPFFNMSNPIVCPPAHYCPTSSMILALQCPQDSVSLGGATVCNPCGNNGASLDQTRCLTVNSTCAPGYGYSSRLCLPCIAGKFSSGTAACEVCALDTYTNRNLSATCLFCTDPGLECNSGTGLASILHGYWGYTLPSDPTGAFHTVEYLQPDLCQGV